MVVPQATEHTLRDRLGRPIREGDKVCVAGLPDPADVQVVDPRYGVMVVLVPGREKRRPARITSYSAIEPSLRRTASASPNSGLSGNR